MRLTLIGLALRMVLALSPARVLIGLLFGVRTLDMATFVSVPARRSNCRPSIQKKLDEIGLGG
jgi:hypothetical protein